MVNISHTIEKKARAIKNAPITETIQLKTVKTQKQDVTFIRQT